MKRNAGFSLVELVIVIVVLGLLAVAALPRFLDVTDSAKQASIEGVAGGYATAVLSARAQWEAEVRPNVNGSKTNTNFVNYDGTEFWLTTAEDANFRDGYPIALKGGEASAPKVLSNVRCVDLMNELLQNPPKVGTSNQVANDDTYKYEADVVGTTVCRYTQLAGTEGTVAHYFDYDVTKGSVEVTLN